MVRPRHKLANSRRLGSTIATEFLSSGITNSTVARRKRHECLFVGVPV